MDELYYFNSVYGLLLSLKTKLPIAQTTQTVAVLSLEHLILQPVCPKCSHHRLALPHQGRFILLPSL